MSSKGTEAAEQPAGKPAAEPPYSGPMRRPINEAAKIMRMSIAQTWKRVYSGELKTVREGKRHYVTDPEIARYVLVDHE